MISTVARNLKAGKAADYEDLDANYNNRGPPDIIEMQSSVTVVPDESYTVGAAVNAFGFGKFQVKLSLFTGLCWMADSMEMTILSILSPALHCDWKITQYQQALTTTVVFLGMMVSSTFWGVLSDRYGRKQALTLCSVLLFYFALMSSFAPTFGWILLLRGLVGFAIGCVPQSVTLYAEFLPTKQRAKCVVLLDCFWALGACFEVLLALFVMPTLGWKWLLGLSTIPLFAFACACPWLPESARYHVASGQTEQAEATLRKIARDNGKPMLMGRLVLEDGQMSMRGRVKDLLSPEFRKTSLLLWTIWIATAFCYYGVVLMTTELFEDKAPCHGPGPCASECKRLSASDYMDLLWTTLAEFPGIFATIFVIERFGRKKTIAAQFLVYTVSMVLLQLSMDNRAYLTGMLFVSRGIVAGIFQAAYVYTPEVYPTPLRAVGVGTCSAMARLGAMVTPYVAQVLLKTSTSWAITVYAAAAILAATAALFLPYETKGVEMKETMNSQRK
ncbi:synaptic vesicle 2-related protein [Neocloeon triangulifer]|uniref:synaptic vesicle 2-related protein n=1 Tax=Neocloeon triangulifer TaxID=2078957 RepID=UPI00286F889B|nr:synaptic vesicle 2-related protein [Neocloeon triangulifer]